MERTLKGSFKKNYPVGEGVWHFENGNTVKGRFMQEEKENPNPPEEGKGEERVDNTMMTVITFKTDPQTGDLTRVAELE